MPRDKVFTSCETAVADIPDGATVLIGGFAGCGLPRGLIEALASVPAKDLTIVFSPGAGGRNKDTAPLDRLLSDGQMGKLITSSPFESMGGEIIQKRWESGQLEIEVIPQGTLAERLRAAGAGLGGVFIPTGIGTRFSEGREIRRFNGRDCVFEPPLHADFAFIRAKIADALGNLVYQGAARNLGPVMAMAASVSIAEADRICELGGIDPEVVISPGIFVNRVVQSPYS